MAQGKGLDLAAAKASGIMEAVEAYHAETITAPVRYARRADMAQAGALAGLESLPRCRPEPLPLDERIFWIEGREMSEGSGRDRTSLWLPLETVSTDYTLPQPPGSGYFQATTNGLAAGNTHDEACLHALCELIERDATTLWHLGDAEERARTRLDLQSVDDPHALELLRRFRRAGVAVAAWETTTDVGVPSFVVLVDGDADGPDPELGAGCHPARGVALCRALAEAAQARVGFVSASRDDLLPSLYAPAARRQRRDRAKAWLAAPTQAHRSFSGAPEMAGGCPGIDLARVCSSLRAAGLDEIIRVDLTKPALGIPVVRMVVPGLEGPLRPQVAWQPGRRARAVLERRP